MNLNYFLKDLPERASKPRNHGLTMAMDKGLSVREVEDFLSVCSDFVEETNCVASCSAGYYEFSPDLCKKCLLNCNSCTDSITCDGCYYGYYLY